MSQILLCTLSNLFQQIQSNQFDGVVAVVVNSILFDAGSCSLDTSVCLKEPLVIIFME